MDLVYLFKALFISCVPYISVKSAGRVTEQMKLFQLKLKFLISYHRQFKAELLKYYQNITKHVYDVEIP